MSGWHAPWSDIDCFPIQILFDKNGQPFRRYASMVEPFEIEEDIISLLAQWKLWIECFSSPRMTSGSKALAGPGRWGSPSPPCAWGRVLWRHWTRKYTVSLQQYTCFCQEIWMISLAFFQLLGPTSNRAFEWSCLLVSKLNFCPRGQNIKQRRQLYLGPKFSKQDAAEGCGFPRYYKTLLAETGRTTFWIVPSLLLAIRFLELWFV